LIPPSQIRADASRPPAFILPFMKLPLIAFRLKINRIFGGLFACITHEGRKTGRIHQTILVVMAYDPDKQEICVVSPWSASNWLKNIRAGAALRVQTGSEDFVPEYRYLTPEEIATLMESYRTRHPILSRILCRIPGWKWDSSHAEFVELATSIRGVAFRPRRKHLSA
jgi:deazaflavin-dependent oxidoreductase (nitroreductase family)